MILMFNHIVYNSVLTSVTLSASDGIILVCICVSVLIFMLDGACVRFLLMSDDRSKTSSSGNNMCV
jgi:hypothetical protein